jgi:hypothetical protein
MLKMMRILIIILTLTFIGCQQSPNKSSETKKISVSDSSKKTFDKIDTSKKFDKDNYYQFVRSTDSTSLIKWGNKSVSNISNHTFDNWILNDKIYLKWSNKRFITLTRSCGSDASLTIILPLIKGQDAKMYNNLLTVDKDNGIVVCEYYSKSDTVLLAENVITGKKQSIGKDWEKCSSGFNHYCIDSINISNNMLYVEWTVPNYIDKPNKKVIKRIKLDL